ncbi:YjbQ family protein [Propionivibrio sp.]|uniref:YjbQ family protein n=1 Tax=Propionivibrio sp. TaxID=2212460 RepID=UPI0025CDB69C|nr:YjbQ family protein [Propionivibrio sp.]
MAFTVNADPDARFNLETLTQRWAPDGDPAKLNELQGDDEMTAHPRSVLMDISAVVPVGNGRLLLCTLQGINLWVHRTHVQLGEAVATVTG